MLDFMFIVAMFLLLSGALFAFAEAVRCDRRMRKLDEFLKRR